MNKIFKYVLLVLFFAFLLFIWQMHPRACECNIAKDKYYCLFMTTKHRKEFSQKKFFSIKEGMSMTEVESLIGEHYYSSKRLNGIKTQFWVLYTEEQVKGISPWWRMFIVNYDCDSLVINTEVQRAD